MFQQKIILQFFRITYIVLLQYINIIHDEMVLYLTRINPNCLLDINGIMTARLIAIIHYNQYLMSLRYITPRELTTK